MQMEVRILLKLKVSDPDEKELLMERLLSIEEFKEQFFKKYRILDERFQGLTEEKINTIMTSAHKFIFKCLSQ